MPIFHHFYPKLGVGCVYGNVQGGKSHFYDSCHVLFRHIGKGDVVSVNEGEAGVVILEIEGVTEPLGVLVDEAEDAAVLAGVLFIHQGSFKIKTYIVILAFFDFYRELLTAA